MTWQRMAQVTGLGLLLGAMAWVTAQSQVTTPVGSFLELGGQVVAPANSPTLNSTLDLSGNDQVRWTSYFQSKLDGPQETEGVLDIPSGHTWLAGSVRKPANATLQWLVNGQWTSTEPASGSTVTQVKWTLAPLSRLVGSQSSPTGKYLGRLGAAYRLIPYKNNMFVSIMGTWYGGSTNSGYLICRQAAGTLEPCTTRVPELAAAVTGLPGVYLMSPGGYSFPDKEGELLQYAGGGPNSKLWHSSIVPLENVNHETGELFMGMQKADGSGNYVVCLNLDTLRHCGQWRLSTSKEQLINLGSAGTKYFTMVDAAGTVVCFDTAQRAECGRYTFNGAYDLIPGGRATQALLLANNLYILNMGASSLQCLDVNTMRTCSALPMAIRAPAYPGGGLYPYLHPDGRPRGVCYGDWRCAGLDGEYFVPNEYYRAITSQSLNVPFHNADAVVGSKIYLRYGLTLSCWDFATDSQCGFFQTPRNETYLSDLDQVYSSAWDTTTTRIDPTRPNCVLIVGANGQAHMFDPTKTGGWLSNSNPPQPCGGGGGSKLPELDANPSQALQCDATRAKVLGWDRVRLSRSLPWGGASGLSGVKVTLKTPAGATLPEALKPVRYFDIGSYALDISDIPYSDYPALKVAVELQSPGGLALNGSAGVDVTWKGDAIQVCVGTQAPADPDCQTVAKLTVNSKLLGSLGGQDSETLQVSKVMSPGGISSGYSAVATATSARAMVAHKGPRDPQTMVTQGRWNLQDFSGDLWAFALDLDGSIRSSAHFSAQQATAEAAERPMFVATPSGGAMPVKPLAWAGLTPAQQAALNTNLSGLTDTQGAARLAYLRGADGSFRPRGGKSLGPVINSSPAMLLPTATLGLSERTHPGYTAYRSSVTRPYPLALFGGNDGALHAYEVRREGVREAWSFVPDVMLARAAHYADASLAGVRANPYFVDNIPMVSHVDTGSHGWRAVAVLTYGRGARAITALDVTSTDLAQGKGVLFDYNNTTDPALKDLGYIVSQPVSNNAMVAQQIVQMGTPDGTGRRTAVLVGNGLNSHDGAGGMAHSGTGKPVLYAFYFDRSGAPRWHRWAVDELWAGAASEPGLTVNNGLSTPTPVDTDGDGRVDVVYAGDLQGNLWRFDVRNPAAATVSRLFQADTQQPITQAPLVTMNTQASGCGSADPEAGAAAKRCWQVVFSTGAPISPLLGSANVGTQSLYGVLDKGRGQVVGMGSLTRIGFAANEIVQGVEYRALTPTTVDYQGDALGWRIDLQAYEHGVGAPRLQPTGLVMFSSIRPVTPDKAINVCIGPRSWLNEVDPLNGYSPLLPFDTNKDGQIDGQDRLAASSNKPLSPSGMAVSGAQFGPPAVLLAASTQAQQMSLLLPSLGQDTGQAHSWSGGPGAGGINAAPGSNSTALTHANQAKLGRMSWREKY